MRYNLDTGEIIGYFKLEDLPHQETDIEEQRAGYDPREAL